MISMELTDEMLTEISYVQISQYRTKVMKVLEGEVKIPSNIARDSGIRTKPYLKSIGRAQKS